MTDLPRVAGPRPASSRQRPDPDDPAITSLAGQNQIPVAEAIEIIYVQNQATFIAEAGRTILGERYAGVRIADEGHIVVRAVGLTALDVQALREPARDCGVEAWVRTELASRTEADLATLTSDVTQFLNDADLGFAWTAGPRIPHDDVELTMGTGPDQQRIATHLMERFADRGLTISMRSGYHAQYA